MTPAKHDLSQHLPLTDLSFHVLLALGEGAMHGYAIGKEVENRSGGRLKPTTGSLYQALRRLHEDALIAEATQPKSAAATDARRQYFKLTTLGRRVFAQEALRLEGLIAIARSKNLVPKQL